ncbi:hypothetical protein KKF84_15740, partial [Myxococcota bacterium]|nr:hypothetical protein [Myxococcota bacterium]
QQRLVCEHVITAKQIRKDAFDARLKQGIRRYERKHMIFGWGYLNEKLRAHLSRPMLQNDFLALRRMIHERVAHSLAIFEDGTVSSGGKLGKAAKSNDLIGRMTKIVMIEMGIETKEKALTYFKQKHSKDFENMKIAVKLPALPDYYSKNMEFFVKHSVGDLWYDVPYTPTGQRRSQPRSILPSVTLYAVHNGRHIPLARMGTTAGGWQEEYIENQIYLKYKGSDLGPKEWKFIVGAPVWFPPPTTPPRDLITYTEVRGRTRAVIKRSSLGPSYASAYGLAMALHTFTKRSHGKILDLDRGIRTHGSVNYMSIRIGHSHGCHRLHNHIALRLFSNLLRRHPHKRLGQQKADWSNTLFAGGRALRIHLTTKGYYYEMTPPIPIRVTRGYLLGTQKQPLKDLIRIPGKKYKPDTERGMEISPDGSLQPAGTTDATPTVDDGTPSALPDKSDTTDATAQKTRPTKGKAETPGKKPVAPAPAAKTPPTAAKTRGPVPKRNAPAKTVMK